MKNNIKKLFGVVITLLIVFCLLSFLTNLFERKDSINKYADFFKQKNKYDVWFLGASHVINGIYPMELYNKHGIVSYNLGGHGNQIATTYWTLVNALDYNTTDIVVIDCMMISGNWKASDNYSYLHFTFDAFPFSINKVKAIADLLNDGELMKSYDRGDVIPSGEPREAINLLWDFSIYHSRWNELTSGDINPKYSIEKGAEQRISIIKEKPILKPSGLNMEAFSTGDVYLRKIINECKKRNIKVVLTYLPFYANDIYTEESKYVYDVAKELDVDYINFLDLDIIDYETDLCEDGEHLNPSGARKVTNYIGDYLQEKYDIENKKDDTKYSTWNDDYKKYIELKNQKIKECSDIYTKLMLLCGDDVDIKLNINDEKLYEDKLFLKLINQLKIKPQSIMNNTNNILELYIYRDGSLIDTLEITQ